MGHFPPPDTTLVHPTAVKPLRAKGGLASCQSICKPRFMVAQTLMYFAEAGESVRGARPQAEATATTVPHGAKTPPRAKPSRIRARMRCRKKGRFGKESGGEERKDFFSRVCDTEPHSRRLFVSGQTHAIPRSDLWIQSSSCGSSRFSTRLTSTVKKSSPVIPD